jgi:hypothetical protein
LEVSIRRSLNISDDEPREVDAAKPFLYKHALIQAQHARAQRGSDLDRLEEIINVTTPDAREASDLEDFSGASTQLQPGTLFPGALQTLPEPDDSGFGGSVTYPSESVRSEAATSSTSPSLRILKKTRKGKDPARVTRGPRKAKHLTKQFACPFNLYRPDVFRTRVDIDESERFKQCASSGWDHPRNL